MDTLLLNVQEEIPDVEVETSLFSPELPQKIQDYLVSKYEGFLINSFSQKPAGSLMGSYDLILQRGNLEVALMFNQYQELVSIDFLY